MGDRFEYNFMDLSHPSDVHLKSVSLIDFVISH